jgi:hypothetical protein
MKLFLMFLVMLKDYGLLKSKMQEETKKEIFTYMNFNPSTNPIRKSWYDFLHGKSFITEQMVGNGGLYVPYVENLKKSHFIISPPGNGIDCHRNWECLYLNTIPVIQKSNFTNDIFSDLPVVLVDHYEQITEELLNNFLKKEKKYNLDKLYGEYWEKIIRKDA